MIDRTFFVRHAARSAAKGKGDPSGTETITVAGRAFAAQKYVVTGDLERELWFDEAGDWLQSRLEHNGDKITLTRQQIPAQATL